MYRQGRSNVMRHLSTERAATGVARGLFAIVMVFGLAACAPRDRTGVIGAWSGRDSVGTVFYQFRPDGHGYRIFHGRLEQFRYELDEGYPNVIRVFAEDAGDAAARTGLVQVTGRELRLELGEPGSNGPRQLSRQALVLYTPATR